jgi:hypothetical protein
MSEAAFAPGVTVTVVDPEPSEARRLCAELMETNEVAPIAWLVRASGKYPLGGAPPAANQSTTMKVGAPVGARADPPGPTDVVAVRI